MDDVVAKKQTDQMIRFILNEAQDKAKEIEAKALEEFNIQKLKQAQAMKDKIRAEFTKKSKAEEVKRAIARSAAINKSRLTKISARQKVVEESVRLANEKLQLELKDHNKHYELLVDLIVQGLLSLLEDKVFVRCREEDASIVKSAFSEARRKYSEVVKKSCGIDKYVELEIDSVWLHPAPSASNPGESCIGGVVLFSGNHRISVDNTLDARLSIVAEECKPTLRKIMFDAETD